MNNSSMDNLKSVLPMDPMLIHGQLDNGLKYYIRPNQRPKNRAELRLVVRAGSVLEEEDQQGLAHIVEHMAFNGSKRFGARELVSYFESIGARFGAHLNAQTGFDETIYKLQIPMDDPQIITRSFEVMRDWAGELLFLPEEIERERKVGLEEWRQGRGATARIRDQLLQTVFHGSRYVDRLPIGTEESLRNFSHEALIRFYRDWYRSDLMAVIVVGDIDPLEMEEMIVRHFSDLSKANDVPTREEVSIPPHEETLYQVVEDSELPHPSVGILSKTPEPSGKSHGDYRDGIIHELALRVINERLSLMSQEPNAPFLGAHAGRQQLNAGAGTEVISATTTMADLKRTVERLIEEIRRAQAFGLTSAELVRAKKCYLASMDSCYEERETTHSRIFASELVRAFTVDESVPGVSYERQMAYRYCMDIDQEELNAFLSTWMLPYSRVIHLICNSSQHPSVATLKEWVSLAECRPIAPPVDESCDQPLLRHKPQPGTRTAVKEFPEIGMWEWTFANGARLWVKPTDFQNDRIHMLAAGEGGLSLCDDQDYVAAKTATAITIRSGVGEHSLQQLQKLLSGVKVRLTPFVHQIRHGFQGMAATGDLDALLQIIWLYSQSSRFDTQAFMREKELQEAHLKNRMLDPETIFSDAFLRLWWNDHPRRKALAVEQLSEMSRQSSEAFYQGLFHNASDMHYIFVGKIDPATFLPLAEQYLGSLPLRQEAEPVYHQERRVSGIRSETIYAGSEPVARYKMRCLWRGEVSVRDRVLIGFLGELLRRKLRQELREKQGNVYHVGVSYKYNDWPESVVSYSFEFGCDPNNLDALIDSLFEELEAIKSAPADPDDISSIALQILRSHEVQLQDNSAWLHFLSAASRRGEDPEMILKLPSMVESVTAADIQELACRFLGLENRVELRLLPVSAQK